MQRCEQCRAVVLEDRRVCTKCLRERRTTCSKCGSKTDVRRFWDRGYLCAECREGYRDIHVARRIEGAYIASLLKDPVTSRYLECRYIHIDLLGPNANLASSMSERGWRVTAPKSGFHKRAA